MEKRKCLECGEVFNGRADKKFCSDLCRNAYNNKLNSDHVNHVRNINNTLRKNRRIIEDLLAGKTTTSVPKQKLADKNFDFYYHTHILTTRDGKKYIFCYEYGYLPMEKDFYMLVKNEKN